MIQIIIRFHLKFYTQKNDDELIVLNIIRNIFN